MGQSIPNLSKRRHEQQICDDYPCRKLRDSQAVGAHAGIDRLPRYVQLIHFPKAHSFFGFRRVSQSEKWQRSGASGMKMPDQLEMADKFGSRLGIEFYPSPRHELYRSSGRPCGQAWSCTRSMAFPNGVAFWFALQ